MTGSQLAAVLFGVIGGLNQISAGLKKTKRALQFRSGLSEVCDMYGRSTCLSRRSGESRLTPPVSVVICVVPAEGPCIAPPRAGRGEHEAD